MDRRKDSVRIRLAVDADASALHALIEASVRGLMTHEYSSSELEGALGSVLGLDRQLIADQTYFVAEARAAGGEPIMVGCGGWSKRKTLFGSDRAPVREPALLEPGKDAAKIRAFFIHPAWARRGVGSKILQACEDAARAAGFRRFEMGATLTGVPFYEARGYEEVERINVPLANGALLAIVRMEKKV